MCLSSLRPWAAPSRLPSQPPFRRPAALGMLPLTWTSPEEIPELVTETRQRTKRPFGVNLGLAWDQRERLAAALAADVPVVSFFWGDAGAVIAEARSAGVVVFVTVGTPEEGRAAAAAGADVVVAQGWEAGGHVGNGLDARIRSARGRRRRSGSRRRGRRRCRRTRPRGSTGARGRWSVSRYALPQRTRGRRYTPTTAAASSLRARPPRSTAPSSTAAGPTPPTARSVTRRSWRGRRQDDPPPDRDQAKMTSPPRDPTARGSTAMPPRPRAPRWAATSSLSRTGRGRRRPRDPRGVCRRHRPQPRGRGGGRHQGTRLRSRSRPAGVASISAAVGHHQQPPCRSRSGLATFGVLTPMPLAAFPRT